MNGYLDKFLNWISLHLPKEALNALRKIQFTIGTNIWNTLYSPVVLNTHGNKEVVFFFLLQSTPDNSNLSREIEKISSYWEFEANNR